MRIFLKIASMLVVLLLVGTACQSAVAELYDDEGPDGSRMGPLDEIPGPFKDLDKLVADLMAATPVANRTDTDNDTIYDQVEWVIGTDPDRADSDFDLLTDMEEVQNRSDPMTPDSNRDGILDVHEIRDNITDLDGDGIPNVWDSDNDGDGLSDARDLCPFTMTTTQSNYHFDIKTSGQPTTIHFQIRTSNADHMRLAQQVWDWPTGDGKGRMRDLDDSVEDLTMVPILELTGSGMPSSSEVVDFGIATTDEKAYLSLSPMWEYGNIVALQGQMFFPYSETPQNLSFDAELIWRVSGNTDKAVKAYKVDDGSYLTVDDGGTVRADGDGTSNTDLFEVIGLGDGRVALKAWNGLYLSARSDGSVTATSFRMNDNEIFTVEGENDLALKARNGKCLKVSSDGSVKAEAISNTTGSSFQSIGKGYRPESIILASYLDPFSLTGLAIEESHGTDVAVVYNSESVQKTLGANLFLVYQFLRNATNNATDIPELLTDRDMEVVVESYNRTDEAGRALTQHLYKDAMDTFPENAIMPIIAAMQMRTVYTDLTMMSGGSHQVGRTMAADLTTVPLIDRKMMKTDWFNKTTGKAVDMEDVIEEMATWDIEAEDLAALMALVIVWNAGEEQIAHYGGVEFSPEEPGWAELVAIAKEVLIWGPIGWDLLSKTLFAVKVATSYAYLLISNIPSFVAGLLSEGVAWGAKVAWNSVKAIKDVTSQVGSLTKGFMGVLKVFNKIMEVVGVIAAVITLGIDIIMAGVTWFTIASAYGYSAMGVYAATVNAVLTVAWAVFNFAFALLSLMPLIGWIFALGGLLLTLGDYLGYLIPYFGKSFSQWAIETIVDLVTDVKELTMVDLSIFSTDFTIDDKDGNGIDTGDRITYSSIQRESVQNIGDVDDSSLMASYINHDIWVKVPYNSKSETSSTREIIGTIDMFVPEYYANNVEIEGWAEPGMAYINYPFTFGFTTSYKVYHEECWWLLWWHCEEKPTSDTVKTDPETLYFDIMPGSIDEFASWKAITPLDSDYDGINNTAETESSTWKWDSDGDGLGDPFELQIGSDPMRFDTDADGLNDKDEFLYGSDIHDEDTDGDGIFDSIEFAGWVVTFVYEGVEFDWHINSNLNLNDTDGDELNDHFEYLTLQNPLSKDTNGDGIQDTMRDYTITEFDLKRRHADEGVYMNDVVVDEEGYMYATAVDGSWNGLVLKFDPNGTRIDSWTLGGLVDEPKGIAMDDDGNLWICNPWSIDNAIIKFDRDGTVIDTWAESYSPEFLVGPQFLAFDGEGYVYITTQELGQVEKFAPNGTFIKSWGGFGTGDGLFSDPKGIAVDEDGYVYVVDNSLERVQKFDSDGNFIRKWGSHGVAPGQFREPMDIVVDGNGDLIIGSIEHDGGYSRLQKFDSNGRHIATGKIDSQGSDLFVQAHGIDVTDDTVVVADQWSKRLVEVWHNVTLIPANPVNEFPDTDEDGLLDDVEKGGWTINVTNSTGFYQRDVSSDPLLVDTDSDELNDTHEFLLGSDPRSIDTDSDGIPDFVEYRKGTNISNWDTDGDGLDDGTERTFGSDPKKKDTDGEGLTDDIEFLLGSHPNNTDTDADGLTDAEEEDFNSSLLDPDSDNDLMVDSRESELGTMPNIVDFDNDGLMDGFEDIFDTNATNGDTDGDDLPDGMEIALRINPLSNDTDGDGLLDSTELDLGLNPRSGDSDADGVPDLLDKDYEVSLEGKIYVVVDPWNDTANLVVALGSMADVVVVTPEELMSDHKDARYVVLIGDPMNGEGTAGAIVHGLLEDTPDILAGMTSAEETHIAVRYGKWAETQTIVMLSRTYSSDHYRVMGILKSMKVKVTDGALSYDYLSPRSCFKLDDVDTFKQTDAKVWTKLDDMAVFSVDIVKYTEEDTPQKLDSDSGLPVDEVPIGKYLEIEVSENIQNEQGDLITGATIWVYYTVDDLDMNGDGDSNDPLDIDETTLSLFVYDEDAKIWVKLTSGLEWVNEAGVDTTDVDMYGQPYAGFMWANVTHLSLFSAGGRMYTDIVITATAGPDQEVMEGEVVTFDGTDSEGIGGILNYKWTFYYNWETVTLYGPDPTFTFMKEGGYEVTLEVRDNYGGVGTASVMITVKPLKIPLRIGPIVDSDTTPVYGVTVQIIWGDQVLMGTTGFSGFVDFMIDSDAIGKDVTVMVRKKGYESQEYQTSITAAGKLQQSPDDMVAVEGPDTSSAETEGPAAWEYAIGIALLVMVFLVVLISIGKGPKLTRNKEGKSKDGEET